MQRPVPAMNSVTSCWGDFVARSRWSDLPTSVRHEAKRSILNIFGTSLGAANHPDFASLMRLLAAIAGPPQAAVIGRGERFDILNAAFANAVLGNLLEFDDTHLDTVIHPSAPVAPPLFALAEQRGLSGAQILHAFVLGVEIECRLGNSVSPHHYARGWHITATCGVFGAAAASAKLIGLDATSTAHAIGIAASQSAGIAESLSMHLRSGPPASLCRRSAGNVSARRSCTLAAASISPCQTRRSSRKSGRLRPSVAPFAMSRR